MGNVAGASVPYLLHQRPGKISWQWLVGRLESLWRSLVRPPFNLGPPDLGCVLVMHAAIGLMMGPVPPRARQDCDESGGVWRCQYGQERTGDFSNYQAIKIHTKATRFRSDEAAVLKA